jgi:hypothetical protein
MMKLNDDELDQEKRPNQDALLQQLGAPGLQAPLPGGTAGPDPIAGMAAPPQAKPQSNPDYMDWGGIDKGKYDSGHDSPKYQVLRSLSGFDPSKGVTPEVLAALNGLGLGTFSGDRDKIRVGGQIDPRFNGHTEFDLIRGFNDQNNPSKKWGFGGTEGPGQPQSGGGGIGAGMSVAQGGLHSLLQGNPLQGIQAAIGQYAGQGDNLKALLAQLGMT